MTEDWKKEVKADAEGIKVPSMLKHPLKPRNAPDVVAEPAPQSPVGAVEAHDHHRRFEENADQPGLYLYGIVRARGWRGFERRASEIQRIRYRDIEALVKTTGFELPRDVDAGLAEHQKVVEGMMRRATVLPAPFGVVFKGKRPLIRMLQDQYLVFDEGLALLEGHWELRLHIAPAAVGEVEDVLSNEAMEIYAELRRFARAAVPFPSEGKRVLSAAFLVDRTSWVEFIERIEDFGSNHAALTFDVTGPWPAYDFVRLVT
jgi:hypothetical protein